MDLEKLVLQQNERITQLTNIINQFVLTNSINPTTDCQHTDSKIHIAEKESELLRLNKNIRKRADGRFEWRKTICGTKHQLVDRDLKSLVNKVKDYKKKFLRPVIKSQKTKESHKLIDLAWTWYNLNKKGKIESEKQYTSRLDNHISKLKNNIESYTKNDIHKFLNDINEHRTREYCYIILKNVFAEAAEVGIIKRNTIATLKNNYGGTEKGLWYDTSEQKLIYENRHISTIGNEIEFFILVGCRLNEAFNCRPELDKLRIWIERTKSDGTSGYVTISNKYAAFLKENWSKMFKRSSQCYAKEFGKLLNQLKIKRQKNEKPIHRLRHTFATNLYYLGVNDKKRSYLMGHKCTSITNDIYTDFDLDTNKQEVYHIYGDMYPDF